MSKFYKVSVDNFVDFFEQRLCNKYES